MPAQGIANVLATELETVRDVLPLLYERDDTFIKMLQVRGDVEKVSFRNMRLPLQIQPGGKYRGFDPNGGDGGRGSGTYYDLFQVTPQFRLIAVEFTKLVEWSTNSPKKAVANVVKKEVQNAMKQFRMALDAELQTPGNCVEGTIQSIAGQVLTLVQPTGADLFYITQDAQIYDSTLTINRGKITLAQVNPFSNTVTPDPATPLPPGTVAGDVLVIDGVSGASPIGLYGIPYFQSNATTGILLDLNRATYPVQLQTPSVNAANAALTPGMILQALSFIRMALGVDMAGGGGKASKLIAYTHVAQSVQYQQLGITISQIIKEGGSGEADDLELNFTGKKTMYGAPVKESIHANRTRIDFLDLSHWGRAEMLPIDFLQWGGQTNWPTYGQSGGLNMSELFYIGTGFQCWDDSPRSGAYIYSLARPAGF